jgi:ribosomal protein S8
MKGNNLNWFENLKGDNFFAVLDVMIDIKNEIDILSDVIQIPIMQTKIKFPQLCPVSSPDMRDKYCNLRWKATEFLEKKGIIDSYKILQNGHRWKAFIKIELEIKKFLKEYEAIKKEYQMRKESKMDVKEIIKKRFQFLHKVYNLSDADENKDFESYKLGKSLGFSDNFISKVINYLDKEGLIRFKEESGAVIGITHPKARSR